MSQPEEYKAFVSLFNARKYFEAHEALESLWRRDSGEDRRFYQGLIQIAAAFVHFRKGTPEGGRKVLKSALENLEKFRPSHRGLDLEKLLAETQASLDQGSEPPRIDLH